jgi:hypothetical protein
MTPERWRRDHEAELGRKAEEQRADKEVKAEQWRRDHETELARIAEERRAAKEERRAANREAWRAANAATMAEQAIQRANDRTQRAERWVARAEPVYDSHVLEMAGRFHHLADSPNPIPGYEPGAIGCSPQEFIDWQRRQREIMSRAKQTQEDIDAIMRRAK